MITRTKSFAALTMFFGMASTVAAQELAADLASSDTAELRGALQMRYDAALSATRDDSVISANDPQYIWASEAKTQCANALGFLKSGTRDETSVGKCGYAYNRMMMRPLPPPLPPVVVPPPQVCGTQQPGLIFFAFDSDVPGSDAIQTIQFVAQNAKACGWNSFSVAGHTDRAGNNDYNDSLSIRRAESIVNLMTSLGIDRSTMSVSAEGERKPRVPTEDGVRNPQNRRVEITVLQ